MNRIHPFDKEVRSLLATLKRHKLVVSSVDDGCSDVPILDQPAADTILSVDDSTVTVDWATGRTARLYIILGNSPGELVADWTEPQDTPAMITALNKAMSEHTNRWDK